MPTSKFAAWVAFSSFALLPLSSLFGQASDDQAVLLAFESAQCRYCQEMQPRLEQLRQTKAIVRHVDVDQETPMAVRFGIQQLPTYVVMVNGREASRMVGTQSLSALQTALKDAIVPHHTPTTTRAVTPETRLSPTANATVEAGPNLLARGSSQGIGVSPAGDAPAGNAASAATRQPAAGSPMPGQEMASAVARAEAATVRLRVYEDGGMGVGTGTIIDRHHDEYLVLTCGHLFRESGPKARVEIDLFQNGQKQTVEGQVVDYNAKDRDIALVTLRTPMQITPVPVLGNRSSVKNGESVFSYGCDRGADPSRRDTRVTGIDKYNQHMGRSNIEIAGAPIDGRSGGGLFNGNGELIGVCNAADYDGNIGIYAGPGEVHWQLDRIGLTALHDSDANTSDVSLAGHVAPMEPAASSQRSPQSFAAHPNPSASANPTRGGVLFYYPVTGNGESRPEMIVVDNPTAELVEAARREGRSIR